MFSIRDLIWMLLIFKCVDKLSENVFSVMIFFSFFTPWSIGCNFEDTLEWVRQFYTTKAIFLFWSLIFLINFKIYFSKISPIIHKFLLEQKSTFKEVAFLNTLRFILSTTNNWKFFFATHRSSYQYCYSILIVIASMTIIVFES